MAAALAFAYDLIREALSDADSETIARGLLRPAADEAIGLQIWAPRGGFDVLLAPGPGPYRILVVLPDGTSEQAALA